MTRSPQPNFKSHLSEILHHALNGVAPAEQGVIIEFARPKQASHGDYSCNLAMQLAKPLRKSPREVAALLIEAMPDSPHLEKIEIAGAGFINLFLKTSSKQQFPGHVLTGGDHFGHTDIGSGKKIQVEFVSANPTGPLHVGHGRGAAFGASLANVLTAAGFSVERE